MKQRMIDLDIGENNNRGHCSIIRKKLQKEMCPLTTAVL